MSEGVARRGEDGQTCAGFGQQAKQQTQSRGGEHLQESKQEISFLRRRTFRGNELLMG